MKNKLKIKFKPVTKKFIKEQNERFEKLLPYLRRLAKDDGKVPESHKHIVVGGKVFI